MPDDDATRREARNLRRADRERKRAAPPPAAALLGAAALLAPLGAQTKLALVEVASGLRNATFATSPPRDHDRLFVLEKDVGQVRIVKDGKLLARPFLDIGKKILGGGESGLLGLVFHPGYAGNGLFYVDYTRAGDRATVVERYRVSATDPDVADPASAFRIITIPQPFEAHNGGMLAFGRDGFLYVGMGDGGGDGSGTCEAQKLDGLLGKILRIDVDGGSPYAIPPTNPFVGKAGARGEIWSLGWRNPWRFGFDRETGDLYVGDVGEESWEEISFQAASSKGGENYGWKIKEGAHCFGTQGCPPGLPRCDSPALVDPIHEYPNGPGANKAVIGGYVYRGCAIPELRGDYFFADAISARIWSFRYVGGRVTRLQDRSAELGGKAANPSSFGEDADGELYLVDFGSSASVYRIVPEGPPPAVDLGFGKVGGNGKTPVFEACGLLVSGSSARFRLRDAPPFTLGLLAYSGSMSPTTFFFGTIVPSLPFEAFLLLTDAEGEFSFTLPGGGGPASLYAQILLFDPGASAAIGLSNALRIDFGQ